MTLVSSGRDGWARSRLVAGDDELAVESGVDAVAAAPSADDALGEAVELTDGAAVEVEEAAASVSARAGRGGARRCGEPGLGLVAGGAHEGFPLGAVGTDLSRRSTRTGAKADAPAVKLAGGEVRELVAEDFVEGELARHEGKANTFSDGEGGGWLAISSLCRNERAGMTRGPNKACEREVLQWACP